MKTPIEFFLCKQNGKGSCFMAMVDFLAYFQNEFLQSYKHTAGAVVGEVSLARLNEIDLITYSSVEDLLPLVFTNSNYSLELGKGTKIEYNFEKILRNFMDKVFYRKSTLTIQIKEFVYRDDVHSPRKFTNLGKVIEQVTILLLFCYSNYSRLSITRTEWN